MDTAQILFLALSIISITTWIYAIKYNRTKHNAFHPVSNLLLPWGTFVWGDHLVFGAFWSIVTLVTAITQDYILFTLIFSVFWLTRSFGETLYWFMQQFSPINRNPPEKFRIHKFAPGQAVWFIYQIFWQIIVVFSLIATIYTASLWLTN